MNKNKLSETFMLFVGRCNGMSLTKFDIAKFNDEANAIACEIDKYESQIADLQAKVKELETDKQHCMLNNARISYWLREENKQLKQQLRELLKKIVDEIEQEFTNYLPLRDRTGVGFYGKLNAIRKKYEEKK